MTSPLHDFAFVHHTDEVGILDGREAVGNHQRRAVAHEVFERLLHKPFRLGIESRRSLVENQDRRVLQDGPGDAHPLALSARQAAAPVADAGIVSLLGSHDKVVGIGNLGRLDYLLHGSILHAEGDVVVERVVEQDGLLVHVPHQLAQVAHPEILDVDPVDIDAPLVHIVEARQEVGHRRLARTRLTHQSHRLTLLDGEVHMLDHILGVISERHVAILDTLFHVGQFDRLLGVLDGVHGRENQIDTLHRSQTLLYRVGRLREVLGRIDDAVKDNQVVDERSRVDAARARENERTAIPQHDTDGAGTQELAHGVRQCLPPVDAVGDAIEYIVFGMEPVDHLVLGIKSLDDAQPAQRLLDNRHQQAPLVLPFERTAFEFLAHLSHDISRRGKEDKHKNRELPADGKHRDQADDNHNGVLEHHVERSHDRVLDFAHITRHARHYIALLLTGKEAYGQAHHLLVDIVANIAYDTRPQRNHEVRTQIGGRGLEEGHHDEEHPQDEQGKAGPLPVDNRGNVVVEVVNHHIFERT